MKDYSVSPQPSIVQVPVHDDDVFLLIASDGLWDFLEEDDVGISIHCQRLIFCRY